MEMRKYTPADLENVVAICRSNIPKYFKPDEETGLRNFLNDERGEDYYVFEVDGEIVGAGGIALNEDQTVSLCWGMLRNDLIGTELGKQMTQFRIDLAVERYPGFSCHSLDLATYRRLLSSVRFSHDRAYKERLWPGHRQLQDAIG